MARMHCGRSEEEDDLDTKISRLSPTMEKKMKNNSHCLSEARQRRISEWNASKTALNNSEAETSFPCPSEKNRTKQENDYGNCSPRSKHKSRGALSSAAGASFCSGQHDVQTSGPDTKIMLPSPNYDCLYLARPFPTSVSETHKWTTMKDFNLCLTGRQSPHSPIAVKQQDKLTLDVLNDQSTGGSQKNGAACAEEEEEEEQSEEAEGPSMSENDILTKNSQLDRRLSQIPVHRMSSARLSAILKRMIGYQQNDEDMEFLKHMQTGRRAIKLKAESLQLHKELCTVNQERELLAGKWEKIKKEILEMQMSYDRTVKLGRAFLYRQNVASAESLSSDAVLAQLKLSIVQQVQQQEKAQLQTLAKELKWSKIHATKQTVKETESFSVKMESYEQQIQAANSRLQVARDEVETLKCEAENLQETIMAAKENLNITRVKIHQHLSSKECGAASVSITSEEKQRMDRRLKRILRRKDLFLEREKILHRFAKLA